uniref:Uncharacterized protein n=1 Tax=Oryza punctata TaxID=4537 RepID=A0A0E0JI57_ORYPU
MEGKLDNSLELLAGVTALLLLALEGLALEGQNNGSQRRLAAPMAICFFSCLFGVCFMLLQTIPPPPPTAADKSRRASIVRNLSSICDVSMALAIAAVMLSIMIVLVKLRALLLLTPLFLIVLAYIFDVADISRERRREGGRGVGGESDSNGIADVNDNGNTGCNGGGDSGGEDDAKPASLELSKVTFTGFLAVAIPAIKNGSPSKSTHWFLIFASSAIVSGFSWRLLTHAKMRTSVNVASFCTHLCIVIATVPFTMMAGEALH